MRGAEYAVPTDSLEGVALAIASLGLSFTPHDSSYWGPYLLHQGPGKEEVKLYLNSDPMFDPQSDPPEERFFKVMHKQHGVLIDATLGHVKHASLLDSLQRAFPGSVRIG